MYLKPVGNVGINLVDETNAIAKNGASLAGLQRGLIDERRTDSQLGWSRGRGLNVAILPAKLDTPAARVPLLLIGK